MFGVIRHAERADSIGATWKGVPWVETEDFRLHPNDPPLSDEGLAHAMNLADTVARFVNERPDGKVHVVVSSPYMRCIQTACEICKQLGKHVRLIVDLSIGEIYGPEVFGDTEPTNFVRSPTEIIDYVNQYKIDCHKSPVGRWPKWPETVGQARKRFSERLLAYLTRGVTTKRNFLLVSHADCVGASLAIMPSEGGRIVETVGYGGMLLASRAADGARPRSISDDDPEMGPIDEGPRHGVIPPSGTPCMMLRGQGRNGNQVPLISASLAQTNQFSRTVSQHSVPRTISQHSVPEDFEDSEPEEAQAVMKEVLTGLSETSWQVETYDVQFGHRWADGKQHAVANAMAALGKYSKKGIPSQAEVEKLLGILPTSPIDRQESRNSAGLEADSRHRRPRLLKGLSGMSTDLARKISTVSSEISYETYLFGFSRGCSPTGVDDIDLGHAWPVSNHVPLSPVAEEASYKSPSATPLIPGSPVISGNPMIPGSPVMMDVGKSRLMQRRGGQ